MIVVDAGQGVDGIEPVRGQGRYRSLRGRHFGPRGARLLCLSSGCSHAYPVTLKLTVQAVGKRVEAPA